MVWICKKFILSNMLKWVQTPEIMNICQLCKLDLDSFTLGLCIYLKPSFIDKGDKSSQVYMPSDYSACMLY